MDPVRNPYSPGAGTPPPALVGRDRELEAFDIAIQRLTIGRSAKSQLLTGPRGVGKTVLLQEFGQIARSHGWVHAQLEASESLDFVEGIALLVDKALLRLKPRKRASKKIRRVLGIMRAFKVRYQIPETGGEVTLEVDPEFGHADSGVLDEDLAELFLAVGESAQEAGAGVLLTIDEVRSVRDARAGIAGGAP